MLTFLMAHLRRWKKKSVFFKARKLLDFDVIHSGVPPEGYIESVFWVTVLHSQIKMVGLFRVSSCTVGIHFFNKISKNVFHVYLSVTK